CDSASSLITEVEAGRGVALSSTIFKLVAGKRLLYRPLTGTTEVASSQWGVTGVAVIVPRSVAPGKPWVFRADAITRDAVVDQALLARGFHIVIPPLTAQSGAVRTQWNNAYQLMTEHGFSKKPVMEGTGTASGEPHA